MFKKIADKFFNLAEHRIGSLSFIYILTLAAYGNIFQNQFIVDDYSYIVDWPLIRDWKNFPKFFVDYVPPMGQEGVFSPLKTLIHAINYHLFGLNTVGYHFVGIVNYLITITFVYSIILLLSKSKIISFLTTLFYALHPIHLEYVTSMTGNVDAIGLTFLFISFYFYILFGESKGTPRGRTLYLYSLLFATLGIYTHELAMSLPFLILWYDFCILEQGKFSKKIFLRIIPFFMIGVIYAFTKFLALHSITRGTYIYNSFALTMLVVIKALPQYVYLSFFPFFLTHNHIISKGIFSYDQEDFDKYAVLSQSWMDPQVIFSILVLGSMFYFAYRQRKENRLMTFWIGWFFVALLPALNIVPSSVYFAERYIYIGSLGFCWALAYYFYKFIQLSGPVFKFDRRSLSFSLIILISILFMVRIWSRNADARDEIAIFESAVRGNPQSANMRTDLGIMYTKYDYPEKALESFEESLKIKPDNPEIYFAMSEAYTNLKQLDEAINALRQAIALNPSYAEAYYNLAGIYAHQGERKKAKENLNSALFYYEKQGKLKEAKEGLKAFTDFFGSLDNP